MPLSGLADEIATLSRLGRQTPVLVTPSYLSLRKEFFVELSRELSMRVDHRADLRIDWLCNMNPLRQRLARFRATRINAAISRESSLRDRVVVVVAASVGRSESAKDKLILGLCDEYQDLPAWARKIQLRGFTRHPCLQLT